TSVDIMVAASLGAITLAVVARYWLPIVVMGVLAGAITMITLIWMSPRIFTDYQFPRFILIYGALTGTLPSGLALLRIIDREFSTPASRDYMYASAVTFPVLIPMIMSVNLPAYGYARSDPTLYWLTTAIFAVYLIVSIVGFRHFAGKGAFRKPGTLWRK
ncbi:unnamed protein product, partial [marine sediment metagenome]